VKKALAWTKGHLAIVITLVVALTAFPTLWVMSHGWSKKIHDQVEQEVSSDLRELNQINVSYNVPFLDPTTPALSISRVPNAATTAAIKSWLDSLKEEADRLDALALKANDPARTPLVEGLFPKPKESDSQRLRLEMARVWPGANAALIDDVGAGSPPDADLVYDQLLSQFQAERQRILGVGAEESDELPETDLERISKALGDARLTIYKDRADSIQFYASPDALAGVGVWDETQGAPSLELCWEWQFRYWVSQDALKAIALANTDEAGQQLSTLYGPVKRVESISTAPWGLERVAADATGKPPATANLTGEIRRDYEISPTGRVAWPAKPNPMYDIRYIDLSLIVDSSRLAQVIKAFGRAGLMSVVDLSVESYDATQDLREGFVYGSDPVVRVRMRVESLWMRQWMAPMTPDSIRAAMGIPDSWAKPKVEDTNEVTPGSPAP